MWHNMRVYLPILYQPIPATRCYFALFQRIPLRTKANTFMTLESSKDFATLPIPEPTLTLTISRHNKASIRRKIDLASISNNDMSSKPLLFVKLELLPCAINYYLVIQTLRQANSRWGEAKWKA
jgi:hypothetical protein